MNDYSTPGTLGPQVIPSLEVEGETIGPAWERAVVETMTEGMDVESQYDRTGDPPTKDCSMKLTVQMPELDPVMHKCLQGNAETLNWYNRVVLDGELDDKIGDGVVPYTYYQRLFEYPGIHGPVDQIENMINRLMKSPHTRRAQATTWVVDMDSVSDEPPCLQRVWCRLSGDGDLYFLNMNVTMRSWDIYKAGLFNMFAFITLQLYIAQQLTARMTDADVVPGRYVHFADSCHIYGQNLEEVHQCLLKPIYARSMRERMYSVAELREDGLDTRNLW